MGSLLSFKQLVIAPLLRFLTYVRHVQMTENLMLAWFGIGSAV